MILLFRCFFLLLTVIYCYTLSLYASDIHLTEGEKVWLKKHPIITLGSDSAWAPYVIENEDGSITGYDKDVLDLINQKMGSNFQLVLGRWKKMVDKATKREIDGLTTSIAHKERAKFFLFSDTYISHQRLIFVTLTNPKKISSVNDLSGKRIGYQESNLFDKKLLSQFTNSTLVPMKSLDEILKNLLVGKIDATIGSQSIAYQTQKRGIHYLRVVDYIPNSHSNLVFSIRKDYPEAHSILNKGLKAIKAEKLALINKWFLKPVQKDPNALSDEEEEFIQNHPVIRFRVRSDRPPYEFFSNGKADGIAVDYIKAISSKMRFKAMFIQDDRPISDAIDSINKKRKYFDTLLYALNTKERKEILSLGDSYLAHPIMIVTHKKTGYIRSLSDLSGKQLAIEKGSVIYEWVKRDYPEIDVIYTNTAREALQRVNEGKVAAYIGNMAIVNYMINHEGMDISKIESGKLELNNSVVRLVPLFQEMQTFLLKILKKRGWNFAFRLMMMFLII